MSQITLPWIEKAPQTLGAYRRKAVLRLIGLGLLLLFVATLFCLWLEPLSPVPGRLAEWKIPLVWIGVIGAGLTGLALVAGGLAVASYRRIGAILRLPHVALALFCGGVVATCLIVWLHAGLFRFIEQLPTSGESHRVWLIGAAYSHTVRDIFEGLHTELGLGALFAYLLWPLQFGLIRDLVALGGIVGFVSLIPLFGIWWERKVSGRIQSRLGPMRVGGWHGWLQSPADGIKLIFKEDLIPPEGDRALFKLAPYLTFVPPICAFIALPFAGLWVFRDLDVALIFILAMLGIDVIGVILAGWASNNKWSVYGAVREACQMVSYEIPMGMALLVPVMMAGSLQLTTIVERQAADGGGFWHWFVFTNPWCFAAFFIYYAAALASCKRAPFDLPESESELVAGFLTEYSGFRWSLFFFGEYVAMFIVSGLAVILFLGGWSSPLPASWFDALNLGTGLAGTLIRGLFFDGPILFILKAALLFYVQLWIRWTLPRVRIDQVLYACVQVLLPLMMAVLLANTLWILGTDYLKWNWLLRVDAVLHWTLVGIGAATAAALLGIAAYGYVNRRRLVGTLAVDALPGS